MKHDKLINTTLGVSLSLSLINVLVFDTLPLNDCNPNTSFKDEQMCSYQLPSRVSSCCI